MKILVSIEHGMGWGDFIQRLISSLNYIHFVKENCPDAYISFVLYEKGTNFLEKSLNTIFLKSFVNHLNFKNDYYIFENFNAEYGSIKYKRLYSIFNHRGIESRCPGFWDVFVEEEKYEEFKAMNLNAYKFGYRNISENEGRVPDHNFPIFNVDLYNEAKEFINNNFTEPYESIYYRSSCVPDIALIEKFSNHLKQNLDLSKTYFVCSNVSDAKISLQNAGLDLKMIRPIETHNKNYTFGVTGIDEKIFSYLVTETVLLSKSKRIHYCGDHYVVSVFNWYPALVKGIELINYDPILRV